MKLNSCVIAKIDRVIDGDTVHVITLEQPETIRIAHIDAPEKGHKFWREAKEYIEKNWMGKDVFILSRRMDKYNRYVATIEDKHGKQLGWEMISNGLAFWYRKYSDEPFYGILERDARKKKINLWSDDRLFSKWIHDQKHGRIKRKNPQKIEDYDPVVLCIVNGKENTAECLQVENYKDIELTINRYFKETNKK